MPASPHTISGTYTARWRSVNSLGGITTWQLVPLGMSLARRPFYHTFSRLLLACVTCDAYAAVQQVVLAYGDGWHVFLDPQGIPLMDKARYGTAPGVDWLLVGAKVRKSTCPASTSRWASKTPRSWRTRPRRRRRRCTRHEPTEYNFIRAEFSTLCYLVSRQHSSFSSFLPSSSTSLALLTPICWVSLETWKIEPSHLSTATHRHTLSQNSIA